MFRKRNGLGETGKQTLDRRVTALEIHIQDTEARFAELEGRFNVLREDVIRVAKTMDEEWEINTDEI